jgi:hypothetical protein
MTSYRDVSFTDELLSDGSVHRRFSDGREEWRWRGAGSVVHWRDNRGATGTDEALGARVVKRAYSDGRTVYGREQGYGRTAWGDSTLTVNRTSFGGRVGTILAAAGAGFALGAIVAPPMILSPLEEDELRRQQAQSSNDSGGDGGGDSDWGDDGMDSDDDFG